MNRARLFGTAAVAAVAMGATGALAADLPVYQQPAAAAPATPAPMPFSWTGFYGGLNLGYGVDGRARLDAVLNTDPTGGFFVNPAGDGTTDFPSTPSFGMDGFFGGAQVGYNQQFGGFVAGIEADIQYARIRGSSSIDGAPGGPGSGYTTELDADLRYFGTVRGRLGYAFDRLLAYGTGGLAVGRVTFDRGYEAPNGDFITDRDRQTHVGYAVGGGIEYALTDAISIKGEYLYADFGEKTYNATYSDGTTGTADIDIDTHLVRIGVNYRF